MLRKIAYANRILRALAEKQAGIMTPVLLGAGMAAGAHALGKGMKKAKQYQAGFAPGVAETRIG